MDPLELRKTIALASGWKDASFGYVNRSLSRFVSWTCELPDYANDRNAIAQAVATLSPLDRVKYVVKLREMAKALAQGGEWEADYALSEASAALRCDAFLSVIGERGIS